MPILNTPKALGALPKTIVLLNFVLKDVTQEKAVNSWDGDWNALYVVCHLRDFEIVYTERLRMMLEQDNPTFPENDQNAMVKENRYDEANLREVLAEFEELRRSHIAKLKMLTDEQWERRGQHPAFGETNILTASFNTAIHDLNHIEQISRALGKTQVWG